MEQLTDRDRKTRAQARLIIVVVIAMFVAPIVLAWWFVHRGVAIDTGHALTNHGTLITPPVAISAAAATRPLGELDLRAGDWAVIFYGPGPCAELCQAALDKLSIIRSVLGHDGSRVHVVALTDSASPPAPARAGTMIVEPEARKFLSDTLQRNAVSKRDAGIVFLDWRGQIMMAFPAYAKPADIKDDLQRLLRASRIE